MSQKVNILSFTRPVFYYDIFILWVSNKYRFFYIIGIVYQWLYITLLLKKLGGAILYLNKGAICK